MLGSYGSTLWYIPSSTPKKTPFSINVCTLCDFMCVCVSGLNLRNGFWVFIYLFCLFLVLFFFTSINVCTLTLSDFVGVCVSDLKL